MHKVVVISGHLCSGKSELASELEGRFGFRVVKSSEILSALAGKEGAPDDRSSLQNFGDEMDRRTDGAWLFDEVARVAESLDSAQLVVVDNVRTLKQLEHFRRSALLSAFHVHLYILDSAERERRWRARAAESGTGLDLLQLYPDADLMKNEEDILAFKRDADVRVETSRSDNGDTLVRVAGRLGLYSDPTLRCVDVIVGGQFGSEGKGNIAAYIAHEYDVLVRVGGPNAGHTVLGRTGAYVYHQLPSGAKDVTAHLLLGPGMTLDVKKLLQEIAECGITEDRLFIDPQAMVIEEQDKENEAPLVASIASTGQGGGSAMARRIAGRNGGGVRLAKDVDELRPYVGRGPNFRGSTAKKLEEAYRESKSVLLEGTQGVGLSLYHGNYPHVTSRDTNVAGCLAEAGIAPSRVRRTIVVVRYTPIRVGNTDAGNSSGPLKHEIDFATVAQEAHLDPSEVETHEITSTTRRRRRVGRFDWELYRRACQLNAPTDVVLTFADYIDGKNQDARRFDQLSPDTIMFIDELERVARAPVCLISTRFPRGEAAKLDIRNIIDRRDWAGGRGSGLG
jgi:adenylosuccinate synthase